MTVNEEVAAFVKRWVSLTDGETEPAYGRFTINAGPTKSTDVKKAADPIAFDAFPPEQMPAEVGRLLSAVMEDGHAWVALSAHRGRSNHYADRIWLEGSDPNTQIDPLQMDIESVRRLSQGGPTAVALGQGFLAMVGMVRDLMQTSITSTERTGLALLKAGRSEASAEGWRRQAIAAATATKKESIVDLLREVLPVVFAGTGPIVEAPKVPAQVGEDPVPEEEEPVARTKRWIAAIQAQAKGLYVHLKAHPTAVDNEVADQIATLRTFAAQLEAGITRE